MSLSRGRVDKAPLLILSTMLVFAGDAQWQAKRPSEWSEEDSRQILSASPWAREFQAGLARRSSEDELRDGGQMGQPHGVGYDGVDPKGSGQHVPVNILKPGTQSVRSTARTLRLGLRWESALPVRLAELKAHEMGLPTLEGEGYRIAIYGIPGRSFKGEPAQLGEPLRKEAVLRRAGKRDVRPVRVEVFQQTESVIVTYLFPLSAEITPGDETIAFEAHIGRIVISQTFDLRLMQFQGKLEL